MKRLIPILLLLFLFISSQLPQGGASAFAQSPRPSFKQGYAHSASESKAPHLWRGKILHFAPSLGITGVGSDTARDISGYANHAGDFESSMTIDDWVISAGTQTMGYAIEFDGTDDVIYVPQIPISYPFTFSSWINPNSFGDADGRNTLIDTRENNSGGFAVFMENSVIAKGLVYSEQGTATTQNINSNANIMTIDEWQLITVTVDEARLVTMYRNGVDVNGGEAATEDGNINGFQTYHIGDSQLGAGVPATSLDPFPGLIGSVYIYKRALLVPEVMESYLYPLRDLELKQAVIGRVPDAAGGGGGGGKSINIIISKYFKSRFIPIANLNP